MISTILWDVDGTLLDFDYSQELALRQCFQSVGLHMTRQMLERYSQINDTYWKRLERGEVTKAELLVGRFTTLFEEFRLEGIDAEAFRAEYQDALGKIYAYIDDSPSVLEALQQKSIHQYVITNGVTATQQSKLKLSGLERFMDALFISEQIGTPKPGREFFEVVLDSITEKDRSKILVVGDSLTSDIKGGVQVGLKTCWYRKAGTVNTTELQPDYEISDLKEIFTIVNEG